MNMKNIIKIVMLSILASMPFRAFADGFAIVIDPKSYEEARNEVAAYSKAVESRNGWKVEIVIDKWQIPDSVRAALKSLHERKRDPIVGCVLIGDIPVAMIRDAQHMSSAFKMDQRSDRRQSSIPSDRYYDDFSLEFDSLGKDEEAPYFYYSLTPGSSQVLEPDIFSGRIRPTDAGGVSRYAKLRAFLRKVVDAKLSGRVLGEVFYFSGQGYISESKTARIDEKVAFHEHFPWLADSRRNAIGYMDHSDHNPIKEKYMNELMRSDLDLAVLHHHGAPGVEYLNEIPPIKTVADAKEFIVRNLREHVYGAWQRGKDADSVSLAYRTRFDVPEAWLSDAMSDSLAAADSAYDASFDLFLKDFSVYGYEPEVPVVMLDACYNGSFHLEDCIADEYIFQPGRTVAVIANTVNVLQDKWSDHFLGLIGQGACVGELPRLSGYMESHLIGDPTYRFSNPDDKYYDIEGLLLRGKASEWSRLLKSGSPDMQALAMHRLAEEGKMSAEDLLGILKNSEYGIVRLQALEELSDFGGDAFIEALECASQDGYEYLQRRSINYMAESGDPRLIPALIKLSIANNTSDRCTFAASNALRSFPRDELMAEFEMQFSDPAIKYIHKDSVKNVIASVIKHSSNYAEELKSFIPSDGVPAGSEKGKRLALRSIRNIFPHYMVPEMIEYLRNTSNANDQIMLLDAFGWHPCSYQAEAMKKAAYEIGEDPAYPEAVRLEAKKTYKRLTHE